LLAAAPRSGRRRIGAGKLRGLGTALNVATVLAGAGIGLTLGRFIPDRFQTTIRQAIGLFVVVYAITMATATRNPLVLLLSLLLGVIAGELLRLDDGVQAVGRWAERQVSRGRATGRVSTAFVTTSLLFCVGPLTILGTFNDGAIGLGLLELKAIRVANFLPGLVVAPVIVAVGQALKIL